MVDRSIANKTLLTKSQNSHRCTHYPDVWRVKNGDKQGFSWRDKALKVQCRLDYVLMSKSLLNISKECVLIFAPNTDHSAVVTLVQSEELSRKPGPGFWKSQFVPSRGQ